MFGMLCLALFAFGSILSHVISVRIALSGVYNDWITFV